MAPRASNRSLATKQRRAELIDELERGVVALRSSERWATYLKTQARFHRYSPRNVLLISMQRPTATQVAGYSTWERLGRHVRRGEQGISILAPMVVTDDDSRSVRGFRWVNVFDVSQTDGAPLPSPVTLLEQDDPGRLEALLSAAASKLDFRVVPMGLPPGVNGECRWSERTIAIEASNAPAQRAKTLAHELSHAILHERCQDRRRAEIEAESSAYVVLAALGLRSEDYSFGYVASWLGDDADVGEAIRESCDSIHRASTMILTLIEGCRPPAIVS